MNEKQDKIIKSNQYERRRFLKDALVALVGGPIAVFGGVELGKKSSEILQEDIGIVPETYSSEELSEFTSKLGELYGLDVVADVWVGSHLPAVPLKASTTIIMGEFNAAAITITADLENLGHVQDPSQELLLNGIEAATVNSLKRYQDISRIVPIILATDNTGGAFTNFLTQNKLVSDLDLTHLAYLELINLQVPKVIGIAALGAKIGKDGIGTVRASTQGKEYNRREFLSLSGVLVVTALGSLLTKEVTDRLKIKEFADQELSFEVSDQPDYVQDLILIHHPFNRFIKDIRDLNMLLREAAYSSVNLSDELDTLQISQANGHKNVFSYSRDISLAEQSSSEQLNYIIDSHLAVIKRYPHRFEEIRSAVISSLVLDFGFFSPLLMRLNPSVNRDFNLDNIRSKVGERMVCAEPFLLLCRKLTELSQIFDQSSPEYIVLDEAFKMAVFANTNIFDYVSSEFEMGPTGSESKIDESYVVFGLGFRFSKGLLVTSTYD